MRRVSTSLDVGSIFSAGFILSSIRPAVEAALGAFLCRVEPGKLLLKLESFSRWSLVEARTRQRPRRNLCEKLSSELSVALLETRLAVHRASCNGGKRDRGSSSAARTNYAKGDAIGLSVGISSETTWRTSFWLIGIPATRKERLLLMVENKILLAGDTIQNQITH